MTGLCACRATVPTTSVGLSTVGAKRLPSHTRAARSKITQRWVHIIGLRSSICCALRRTHSRAHGLENLRSSFHRVYVFMQAGGGAIQAFWGRGAFFLNITNTTFQVRRIRAE